MTTTGFVMDLVITAFVIGGGFSTDGASFS
jgi:hypothetical protein